MHTKDKPFVITASNTCIEAYAAERLPFEPKGWKLEFRERLKAEIASLVAAPGSGMRAVYGCAKQDDFFDTENALFYNVSTSVFKTTACHVLAFDTLTTQQTKALLAQKGKPQYAHYYRYEVQKPGGKGGRTAAKWQGIRIAPLFGTHKPYEYWHAFKQQKDKIELLDRAIITGAYGIRLMIHAPKAKPVNLANAMKPLLDGIICAFHSPVQPGEAWCEPVLERLGCARGFLTDTQLGILGPEEYVGIYRNSVKWNPQDDRCTTAELQTVYEESEEWTLDGEIYSL